MILGDQDARQQRKAPRVERIAPQRLDQVSERGIQVLEMQMRLGARSPETPVLRASVDRAVKLGERLARPGAAATPASRG